MPGGDRVGSFAGSCYLVAMTKMERAIARLRGLPLKRQEELADYLIDLADGAVTVPPEYKLTDAQLAEVRLALKELDEGKVASQEEVDALWRRAGLTN